MDADHAATIRASHVPFSATRDLLTQVLSAEDIDRLCLPLRSILHHAPPDDAGLTERQGPKTQVRYYTKKRCLREWRNVAWLLADRYPHGLEVQVVGDLTSADREFLTVVGQHLPLTVRVDPHASSFQAGGHPEDQRAVSDHAVVTTALANADEWQRCCRIIASYLSMGDSWTATWLAEAVLTHHSSLPADAAHVMSFAFVLQADSTKAESILRACTPATGIELAQINYSLALVEARHHPRALRNAEQAELLLGEAWDTLLDLQESDRVRYEKILNRNGLSLLLHQSGRFDDAIGMLEENLTRLPAGEPDGGMHRAVLLHNLARVYARTGSHDDQAEQAFRDAIDIDPKFPEYWLDLAAFLSERGRFDEALDAATEADHLASTIAETPALLGYLHAVREDHQAAAAAYVRSAEIQPGRQEHIIAAAREYLHVGDLNAANTWLRRLNHRELRDEEQAEAELLLLEVESRQDPTMPPANVHARLQQLAERFPTVELVQANLAAFTSTK